MVCYLKGSLLSVLLIAFTHSFAQEHKSPLLFRVETKDGNGYTGELLSSDSVKVRIKAENLGEITLFHKEIKTMVAVGAGKVVEGQFWMANPQSTRYFISPNGYGLKKGEGYYQNIWVLFNSFAVGLSDNVSIGGGMVPLFLLGGTPTPAWISLKASIPVRKDFFNLGAGVLAGTALGENNGGFGIFYGLATLGSRDKNISLGAGFGFSEGSLSSSPMLNLNGMLRVGARSYLIAESYLFPNGSNHALIMMAGARHFIRDAGLDYGLVFPLVSDPGSFIAVPWLGISIPFGGRGHKAP